MQIRYVALSSILLISAVLFGCDKTAETEFAPTSVSAESTVSPVPTVVKQGQNEDMQSRLEEILDYHTTSLGLGDSVSACNVGAFEIFDGIMYLDIVSSDMNCTDVNVQSTCFDLDVQVTIGLISQEDANKVNCYKETDSKSNFAETLRQDINDKFGVTDSFITFENGMHLTFRDLHAADLADEQQMYLINSVADAVKKFNKANIGQNFTINNIRTKTDGLYDTEDRVDIYYLELDLNYFGNDKNDAVSQLKSSLLDNDIVKLENPEIKIEVTNM